ncbi:MAG: peptidylprolyl isomerase [Planctomycetaceae bacterium]
MLTRLTSGHFILLIAGCAFLLANSNAASGQENNPSATLVRVNGEAITQETFDRWLKSRLVSPTATAEVKKRLLNQLVDRTLIQQFLADRKIVADPKLIDARFRSIQKGIRKAGDDPQKVLARLGHTEESFRKELAFTLAWQRHARQTITRMELKELFDRERPRYDGTELRARQIFLKISPNADQQSRQKIINELNRIRSEIISGKTTFEDAAKKYSASPSRVKGGDIGFFMYTGRIPVSISRVAFSLKNKEISKPFLTSFGAHLIQVTDRRPGQLSLEDARPELFKKLSQERWNATLSRLRKTAKIEWSAKPIP